MKDLNKRVLEQREKEVELSSFLDSVINSDQEVEVDLPEGSSKDDVLSYFLRLGEE